MEITIPNDCIETITNDCVGGGAEINLKHNDEDKRQTIYVTHEVTIIVHGEYVSLTH